MTKISVIIPAYNAAGYLDKCLNSVCNQTLKDLEIILINDGSTDDTPVKCEEWAQKDGRIRVVQQENKGVSEVRNRGLDMATAPYVGFVDSDDWIDENMYEQMFTVLQETGADIGLCGVWIEYPGKVKKTDKGKPGKISKSKAMYKLLRDEQWHSFCCNKLFKRELWNGVVFPSGKVFEDSAVMHTVFDKASAFAHTGAFHYHYRQHAQSIGHKRSVDKSVAFFTWLIERYNFVLNYALFSRYQKKQITLLLLKRMVKVFRDVTEMAPSEKFTSEKDFMRSKIREFSGDKNFTEKGIGSMLRKILLRRLFYL